MMTLACSAALVLCLGRALASEPEHELAAAAALPGDDECLAGEPCAWSALQVKAHRADPTDDDEAGSNLLPPLYADAKPEWEETGDDEGALAASASAPGTEEGSMEGMGTYCQSQPGAGRCALYTACAGRSYCVLGNYMVVPGTAVAGTESINGGNAGSYDYLMSVARAHCGTMSCVLMTNPVGHRTQDQLHIHYRQYTGGGAAMKARLEQAVCHKTGWVPFNPGCCGCGGDSKAQAFGTFPGVFSQVASAYGGGGLGNVGISVWFSAACGLKTIVLATTHCSIEHSVSVR